MRLLLIINLLQPLYGIKSFLLNKTAKKISSYYRNLSVLSSFFDVKKKET